MRVFRTLDELDAAAAAKIRPTDCLPITQQRVDLFADATDDHQWIHVDRERALKSPFGGTIAHGYLTLSLLPMLANQLFRIEGLGAKLNYGVNKVRFPAPLPVGSSIRARATIGGVSDVAAGKQMVIRYVVEIEDEDKPAMVAESVVLLIPPR